MTVSNSITGPPNWVIEKDFLNDRTLDVSNMPIDPIAFRLLDGDGNVYFEGWVTKALVCKSEAEVAFEPLDSFKFSHGCTSMQYLENEEWKEL